MSESTRRWWPVGLGLVIGLLVGLLVGVVPARSYTATTTLFLGSPGSVDSAGAVNGDLFSQQRASTYVNLVGNHDVAARVIDELGLALTPEQLAKEVSATQLPKTVLLDLSATADSQQQAADIANAYAAAFTQYVARLETPAGSRTPSSVLSIVQQADTATSVATANIWLYPSVGLLLGLLAGLLAKWAIARMDRTVRTSAQLSDASGGAPVLGELPRDVERNRSVLKMSNASPSSRYAEAMRKLRTNLLYVDVDNSPKSIAFVSPTSSIATTSTASNLAVALDGITRQVVVVDGDLRQPRLASYLGQQSESGLASVLGSDVVLDDVIGHLPESGVGYVLAGETRRDAGELLASDGLVKVFAELRNTHDFVLVDTPGLLATTDATVTGLACDGAILVAVQGKTRVADIVETAATLNRIGVTVLGSVLTETR